MKVIFLNIIFMIILISSLFSQSIPYGQEFQINSYTDNMQQNAAVSAFENGDVIVCWESYGQDSDEWGIFGQKISHSLDKIGNEFRINTTIKRAQMLPKVLVLPNDNFVVCWYDMYGISGKSIVLQFFDNLANKIGNEIIVTDENDRYIYDINLNYLNSDKLSIAWSGISDSSSWMHVYAQVFDLQGNKIGSHKKLSSLPGNKFDLSVSILENGNIISCYQNIYSNDITKWRLYCQLLTNNFEKIGMEFKVDSLYRKEPYVCSLTNGNFVVSWLGANESYFSVFAKIYDSIGQKISETFLINSLFHGYVYSPIACALPNGEFIIFWSGNAESNPTFDIYGQIFNPQGIKKFKPFRINSITEGRQRITGVASIEDIGFFVCWDNGLGNYYSEVFGKYFPNDPINHDLIDFDLVSPIFDETIGTTRPEFFWREASLTRECFTFEIEYDLYVDTDINFPHPQIINNIQDTTYTIDSLDAGKTYFWKVLAKNLAGDSLWSTQQDWGFFIKRGATSVATNEQNLPKSFELFQNYPNPFNSSTEIQYALPNGKVSYKVQLKIYDILGRLVKVLVDQVQSVGTYAVNWDGRDLEGNRASSGVYLYSLDFGLLKSVKKMLMLQ